MTLPPENLLGMTLADFSAHHGKHPQSQREDYRTLMRQTPAALLPTPTRQTTDPIDGTIKFCLPITSPNNSPFTIQNSPFPLETESVIIPMTNYGGDRWYTLCLSSQVGCRMACTFCETGRMGLLANLTPAQIITQRLVARTLRTQSQNAPSSPSTPAVACGVANPSPSQPPLESSLPLPTLNSEFRTLNSRARPATNGYRYFSDGIQNIVFMGMGEPLDNFDNLIQSLRVLSDPAGLDFPLAQITVSTVGRIDGLQKLATLCNQDPQWKNLRIAISLNAPTDSLRNTLMPINKAIPLADLKQTLLTYPLAPKARFLIEYVIIKDLNHAPEHAAAVADFCRDLPCIVNLIPYNPQHSAAYETPTDEAVQSFMAQLKSLGLFVKRRVTHGRDLMSACGQLGNPSLRRKSTPV